MNRWRARRSFGLLVSLIVVAALWGGAVWAGMRLAAQLEGDPRNWALSLGSFGLMVGTLAGLALGGVVLYRALSALTLHYRIDRNAVTIHWLGNTAVIPMDRITAVEIGAATSRLPNPLARSFGYGRGQGLTAAGTPLYLYTTAPLKHSVTLHTATSTYAISPANRDAFVQEVEERRNLGIVQGQSEGVLRTTRVSYPFWTDGLVRWCLALGLLLNLALWGLLAERYARLDEMVALRFDATGTAIGSVPREQLLALPLIGFLAWLANAGLGVAIYRLSRAGAIILLVGTIVVQSLMAISLLGAMR